jgi:hypothetical protein
LDQINTQTIFVFAAPTAEGLKVDVAPRVANLHDTTITSLQFVLVTKDYRFSTTQPPIVFYPANAPFTVGTPGPLGRSVQVTATGEDGLAYTYTVNVESVSGDVKGSVDPIIQNRP